MSIDLDAIRAREAAATPGPWFDDGQEIYTESEHDWVAETLDIDNPKSTAANAQFIAHAREDIPGLLAEVDRLRAELAAADLVTSSMRLAIDEADAEENAR